MAYAPLRRLSLAASPYELAGGGGSNGRTRQRKGQHSGWPFRCSVRGDQLQGRLLRM